MLFRSLPLWLPAPAAITGSRGCPSGAGHRQCPGKDVALLEGQLILARILQRYELTPVAATPPRVHLGATARPGGDVQIRFKRRAP